MRHTIFGTLPFHPNIVYSPVLDSTNDEAKRLGSQGGNIHGLTVLAGHQTAGRGLMGNPWFGEAGQNLYMSLILDTDLPVEKQFLLNIAVALSALYAVNERGAKAKLKWPNDLFSNKQKLGGVLIENVISGNRIKQSIIGLGVNVNQRAFGELDSATSLLLLSGNYLEPRELVPSFTGYLNACLVKALEEENALKDEYYDNLLCYGKETRFRRSGHNFTATVLGVDDWGRLVLQEEGRKQSYGIKEVEWIW